MWIVEVALRRPYTFLVMALLVLLATPLVLLFDHQDLLSAEREYTYGHCAGRGDRTSAIASIAARHPAAAGDQILGIQHPDHPARAIQPHHDGAGRLRCGREFLASPAGHHSGGRGTVALRRKTARHFRRP